jgi:hypothetical protein
MFEVLQHAPIVAPDRQEYWRKSDISIARVTTLVMTGVWARCSCQPHARMPIRWCIAWCIIRLYW